MLGSKIIVYCERQSSSPVIARSDSDVAISLGLLPPCFTQGYDDVVD